MSRRGSVPSRPPRRRSSCAADMIESDSYLSTAEDSETERRQQEEMEAEARAQERQRRGSQFYQ